MLRVLAALFILNVIYLDKEYRLIDDKHGLKMDKTAGSEFFTFYVLDESGKVVGDYNNNLSGDNCLYHITDRQYYGLQINRNAENGTVSHSLSMFMDPVIQQELKKLKNGTITKKQLVEILKKSKLSNDIDVILKTYGDTINIVELPEEYIALINCTKANGLDAS